MRGTSLTLAARIAAVLLVGLVPSLVSAAPAVADRGTQIYGPFMIWNKAGTGCMVGGDHGDDHRLLLPAVRPVELFDRLAEDAEALRVHLGLS